MDANLLEAFQAADVADEQDVANFVHRIDALVPDHLVPDVLLLQEVRLASAQSTARLLGERYGQRFEVVSTTPATPWQSDGSKYDTAVVVNTDTMVLEGVPTAIRTDSGGNLKDNAAAQLREIDGGLSVPVLSVHWAHGGGAQENASTSIDGLRQAYPSPSRHRAEVIAGDFNVKRCQGGESWKSEWLDCPVTAWYRRIETAGFTDAVRASNPAEVPRAQELDLARIDFVFTTGQVIEAGSDLELKRQLDEFGCTDLKATFTAGNSAQVPEPCRSMWYSDHRAVWALIAAPHPIGKRQS